jgi:hypothetical protein
LCGIEKQGNDTINFRAKCGNTHLIFSGDSGSSDRKEFSATFGSDIRIGSFKLTRRFSPLLGRNQRHQIELTEVCSPVLAERLELDSVQKNISEIEMPEIKPQVFQRVIGKKK